jgi:hypothetical protein
MSSRRTAQSRKQNARWLEEDLDLLVDLGCEHRAEFGDGGNPKKDFYNLASQKLEEIRTLGGEKTAGAVEDKWGNVRGSRSSLWGELADLSWCR